MKTKYTLFKEKLLNEIAKCGRNADEIQLIAASKYYGKDSILCLINEGQRHFGENRLQDALPKIEALSSYPVTWHFFGHIQTNKAKKIVEKFSVIHSLDSLNLAKILNKHANELKKSIDAFIEVKLADEKTKTGYPPADLIREFPEIIQLKNLKIKGLMTITPLESDSEGKNNIFNSLKELQLKLNKMHNADLKYLSMGMSDDWQEAVKNGATHLRIGRALFT